MITVAEGVDGDLFLYVYQPTGGKHKYYANYARLSFSIDDEILPRDYRLTYLNNSGVFYKYKVDGVTVAKDAVRYYVVVQIMRPFIDGYDTQADYDNTISAVPYDVSRQYKFSTINGVTSITALDVETILITDKLVGHVVHEKDQFIQIKYTYMHFVAFRCNHDIDDLLEADVSFNTQAYHYNVLLGYNYYDVEPNTVTLYAQNEHEIKYGFGNKQHAQWNEIESVDSFISKNDINSIYATALVNIHQAEKLTVQAKQDLRNMDWVLQFYQVDETTLRQIFGPAAGLQSDHDGVNVTDVTILRLKFVSNGITYNLGVVDNKQTGSTKPSNESKVIITPAEGSGWIWTLIAIALLVVLVVVLWPIVPYIAKFVFWLISLPFKAVAGTVKACKKREPKSPNAKGLAKIDRQHARERRRIERQAKRVNVEKLKNDIWSGKRESAKLTKAENYALEHDPEWKQAEADAWAAMGYFEDGDSDL